jgi:SAM-dependent methyltransferase
MTKYDAIKLMVNIAQRGPTPAMYANVHQALRILQQSGIKEKEIYDLLVRPSWQGGTFNFISTIFGQQFGYAGDFDLLSKFYTAFDMLYTDHAEDKKGMWYRTGPSLWDNYVLSLPIAASLYNREQYLLNRISTLVREKHVGSILDIACGDGRLLKKVKALHPHVHCQGIDMEKWAITKAEKQPSGVHFTQMNALQTLPNQRYELVISAGLGDYLTDAHFTRLLRRIERYTNPKYVIFGNMTHNENEVEMDLFRWKLIYRASVDLLSLCVNHYMGSRFRVEREAQGINLFLNIEPRD